MKYEYGALTEDFLKALPDKPSAAAQMRLNNDTKIAFCNAYDAIKRHSNTCSGCSCYLSDGDGDLCNWAKYIIAFYLGFADTSIEPARAAATPESDGDK